MCVSCFALCMYKAGAVYAGDFSIFELWDCAFDNNTAVLSGGAFYGDDDTTVTLNGCQFQNNSATSGGAVATQGEVRLYNSTLTGNSAQSRGGGISDDGSSVIYLYNTTLIGNTAATGGGVSTASTLTLESSTFIGNVVKFNGGAAFSDIGSIVNITNSRFHNNSAAQAGAAWFAFGTDKPTMINNTFTNSTAKCCYASGYGSKLDVRSGTATCSDTDSGSGEANCCANDQYSDGTTCLRCLERGNCSVVGSTLKTQALKAGNWRGSNSTADIRPCLYEPACIGGSELMMLNGIRDDKSYCSEGYQGPCKYNSYNNHYMYTAL
jgi:predicted outer membrane repeat protein